METLHAITEPSLPRTERQRQAWRIAIERRKLEQMREEKVLHQFVTDVWDKPENTLSNGN
ncbi:MAG: hypothetical protein ABF290_06300 [Thiogranum sp.]